MSVFKVILVTIASAAAFAQTAQAQVTVDLSKITCKQYFMDREISAQSPKIALWLSGYFNGLRNNTTIDVAAMRANKDKVEDYCRMHMDMTIIDAAKTSLGIGK